MRINNCLSSVAGRENRKSDWPWRKRAEQKPHAEFSVGRSSIIGARYRPVSLADQSRPGQARQTSRQAGSQVHLLGVRGFPLAVTLLCRHGLSPSGVSPQATSLISPTTTSPSLRPAARPRDRGRYERPNLRIMRH